MSIKRICVDLKQRRRINDEDIDELVAYLEQRTTAEVTAAYAKGEIKLSPYFANAAKERVNKKRRKFLEKYVVANYNGDDIHGTLDEAELAWDLLEGRTNEG